jgi:tripartite-type tricarboxylate transporter receptor subunit TctC
MVTRLIRNLVLASLAVAVLSASTKIQAQDRYPSRTVKLVVAFAPDGVADIMGRLVAQLLQHKLGGTFVVENKPGGDGLIGMGEVVRASPTATRC